MTLREQIKEIHAKRFGTEFHEYRGSNMPAMVNDLAMKYFDSLELEPHPTLYGYWVLPNTVEIRAVMRARELINSIGLRDCTPAEV